MTLRTLRLGVRTVPGGAFRRMTVDQREAVALARPGGATVDEIAATLDISPREAKPHVAVLLRSHDELTAVLASFYGLGAKRNGWLAHRALPGEADLDRERLTRAGLPVTDLEDEERLAVMEIDPAGARRPIDPGPRGRAGSSARARILGGLVLALAVGPDERAHSSFRPFEDAWDRAFSGRPVVTLCPFVIGELDARAALERMDWLAPMHDSVLLPERGGGYAADR